MAVTDPSRRRRSDHERNRQRIVEAARTVLAARGAGAGVDEIAHRAGVGVGTLYRHFPGKEALIDAVLDAAFDEIVLLAESALAEEDAWTGFMSFLDGTVALHAANSGLRDIVAGTVRGRERAAFMRVRLRPLVKRLVERAQDDGSLRPDVMPEDVPLVFWGAARVIDLTAPFAPDVWQRFLGLLRDGLRADAATPLPRPPLTRAQLERVGLERPS